MAPDAGKHSADGNDDGGGGDGNRPDLLLRKIGSYLTLAPEDIETLRQLEQRRMTIDRNREIIGEGEAYSRIYVLQKGWAIRHKTLQDGRRQIANFILPGDFICLNASLFSRSHYAVSTVTPVVVSPFDPALFRNLAAARPLLAMAVAWCNAREEAMLIEHLTSLGRRTAYERVAHLVMELLRRLEILDLAEHGAFDMPLTLGEIGDCMGLSVVHVSRTLRRLRGDGLIRITNRFRTVQVADRSRLTRAAGFDENYLYFTETTQLGRG